MRVLNQGVERAKRTVTHEVAGTGGIAALDNVRVTTAGKALPASADSEVNATVYGIALKAIAQDARGEIITSGVIEDLSWSWTIDGANNNLLWLDETTAKLTETAPSTVGKFTAPLAQVINATTISYRTRPFSVTENV
jgi:hypothetical protein